MEVLAIIDELEEMIETSKRIPMTNKVMIDADEFLDQLDRLRSVLPEEIRQAKWLTKERDRFLEEAKADAERVKEEAKVYLAKLVDDSEVTKQAQSVAEEIVSHAQQVAREIRQGSVDYADNLLSRLEEILSRGLDSVQQGRSELQKNKNFD